MLECAGNFQPRSCAGADRLSSGMRGAFGKPYGTAARVDIGQVLISLRTKERLVKWSLGNGDSTIHHRLIDLEILVDVNGCFWFP